MMHNYTKLGFYSLKKPDLSFFPVPCLGVDLTYNHLFNCLSGSEEYTIGVHKAMSDNSIDLYEVELWSRGSLG